tara:strand:- start:155 stop:445 length:291 start_codon:yes stop_codon:yes gene_type:complete
MEENKEVTNEKLNYKLIQSAGKNIRNAASIITITIVLNILFSLVVSVIKFSPNADVGPIELAYILTFLNCILGIFVSRKLYKAGDNLEDSVPNDMG